MRAAAIAGPFSREGGIRASPAFHFAFHEEEHNISQSNRAPREILHARRVFQTSCMLKTGDLARDSPEIFSRLQEEKMELIFESGPWLFISLQHFFRLSLQDQCILKLEPPLGNRVQQTVLGFA
jgi:hypothetical protein